MMQGSTGVGERKHQDRVTGLSPRIDSDRVAPSSRMSCSPCDGYRTEADDAPEEAMA